MKLPVTDTCCPGCKRAADGYFNMVSEAGATDLYGVCEIHKVRWYVCRSLLGFPRKTDRYDTEWQTYEEVEPGPSCREEPDYEAQFDQLLADRGIDPEDLDAIVNVCERDPEFQKAFYLVREQQDQNHEKEIDDG
jgi:hypothetical protein